MTADQLDSTRSWVVVASAFLSMFTVFGVAYSFGEFFGPMADEFGTDRSETALFFSITTFAYFVIGMGTGRIADRVGPRPVVLAGAVAMFAGLMLTAEVGSLELGYATYGLGVGIGVACCYVPTVAAVGGWFERRRTLAIGLAVAGIGVGTLVVVPVIELVIDEHGWRNAYRGLAVAAGILLLIAAIGAHRPPGGSEQPMPIREAVRGRPDFWLLYASTVFLSAALFTPFVFMADYIDTTGGSGSAAVLLGLIGMASVAGRLGFGAVAVRFGLLRLYRGAFFVLALSFVLWIVADTSYPILIAFALTLGVSYGGFISLSPAIIADRFGTVGMGGVLGALYTAAGVGGLLGPPTLGAIIDRAGHTTAQWTALSSGLVSVAFLMAIRTPQSH